MPPESEPAKPKDSDAADEAAEAEAKEAPLLLSASPHIRSPESIPRIMWTVSATLVPAVAWGVYVFGARALWVMALGIVTAVATEAACQRVRRRPVTVGDGSAFLTGLLVALVLPVHVPWYVPVMASFFAISVVKQAFGGLGCNIWNPALMGRAFVMAAWTAVVAANARWPVPFHYTKTEPKIGASAEAAAPKVDATTGATSLSKAKDTILKFNKDTLRGTRTALPAPTNLHQASEVLAQLQQKGSTPILDLFLGRVGGCIGEVSALALLVGGVVLIALGYVKWHVPAFYIGTVAVLSWALPIPVQGEQARYFVWFAGRPLFEVLAGGLFLGAFFMATDMVTSPVTRRGLILFGIGCGVLTVVIRRYGGYPEGVCYAILLMNTARPIIDRHTKPKVFGRRAKP